MHLKETKSMTDGLANEAISMGDYIEIRPLTGKKYKLPINRIEMDFVSQDHVPKASKYHRKLFTLRGDSVFVKIQRIEFESYNKKLKERILIQSLNNRAFYLNNNPVFAAILKEGDECNLGHNILVFRKTIAQETNRVGTVKQINTLMNSVIDSKIVKSDLNILLQGETGTGKTTLARKIHEQSKRRGDFVHINLAAFSHNLLESELFGHKKGAFTGAITDKVGAFRQAAGGTLFLDEIDSIPLETQTKLLPFLDDGVVRPVGDEREYKVDCRIIFASGTNLLKKLELGELRKDFYFRIKSGQSLQLESLRNRPDFIKIICTDFANCHDIYFEKKLIEFYQTLPWPGNIRQLVGHLERKKALATARVIHFDQSDDELIMQSSELSSIDNSNIKLLTMKEMREAYALKVYHLVDNNYDAAAKKLDISIKSLRSIIKKVS